MHAPPTLKRATVGDRPERTRRWPHALGAVAGMGPGASTSSRSVGRFNGKACRDSRFSFSQAETCIGEWGHLHESPEVPRPVPRMS